MYPDFTNKVQNGQNLIMTINSTAQPIETHGKLAGVFP